MNNVCYKVTQGTEKEVTFPWVDLRGNSQIEKEGKKKRLGGDKNILQNAIQFAEFEFFIEKLN